MFFFIILSIMMLNMEKWIKEANRFQVTMLKTVGRFLSSLLFISILLLSQDDPFQLVVQFMILYFIFLLFEIVVSLTNLRQN